MAIPGETIDTGALERCEDCETELVAGVYESAAGFYVGTWCQCGPYSRESGYFTTRQDAEAVLGADASEYARDVAPVAEDCAARTLRLLEILADALAAPGRGGG